MEAGGVWERRDPRLDIFIHYLLANVLNIDLYRRALLEQVALQEFEMQGEVGKDVARDTIRQMDTQIEQEILLWHRAYNQSRIVVKVRSRLQLHHPDHHHDAGHIHGMPHQALPPGS